MLTANGVVLDTYQPTIKGLIPSWERSLQAEGKTKGTIRNYVDSVRFLTAFLEEAGMPTEAARITREHVEAFMANICSRQKPSSAETRYRRLKSYFGWLREEGEITASPMEHMRPPRVPPLKGRVLTDAELDRLFAACEGPTFHNRRDLALIRLYFDAGARLSELANVKLSDISWDNRTIEVTGKGSKVRDVAFGSISARDLDRYLRIRERHPMAESEWLWLGRAGRLTFEGIKQVMKRLARRADVPGLHAHLFRHTNADHFLSNGGQESDLMMIMGWSSDEMVRRYASSTASKRAIEAHRKFSPADVMASRRKGSA